MAERIAEQVPKGSRICVQGKLSPASWTNREGVKQTRLRVRKLAGLAHVPRFVAMPHCLYACCRYLLVKSGLFSVNRSLLEHNSKVDGDSSSNR